VAGPGKWAVRVRDGTWELGTGGRITVRSALHEAHAESLRKAQRLLRVFE
jgi:para-aminobenzoate synthetase